MSINPKLLHFILGAIAVVLTWVFLLDFFPNNQGGIGHDYSFVLSNLFDGRIWFDKHGFNIEWFTPAYGAGLPKFPDPQNMQYSLPQFLSHFLSPITSLKMTFFIMLGMGYLFCYKSIKLLIKNPLDYTPHLCSIIFILNSFFLTRMMIGHITYHVFMLLPLSLFLFIKSTERNSLKYLFYQSLPLGYLFYGGASNYAPMYLFSLFLTAVICGNYLKIKPKAYSTILFSFLLSLIIAAPQIFSSLAFLKQFPRDHVTKPMFHTLGESLYYNFKMLFIGPIRSAYALPEQVLSPSFLLEQHELEFNLTLIPLFILIVSIMWAYFSNTVKSKIKHHSLHYSLALILCGLMVFSLLMWKNPLSSWLLNTLPYFKNLSSLLRGLSVFVFPITLVVTLLYYHLPHKTYLTIIIGLIAMIQFSFLDLQFYHKQYYKTTMIELGYEKYSDQQWTPVINGVSGPQGTPNQHFIYNKSTRHPYQPIFGYRLETYPGHQLLISSPLSYTKTVGYNFLNPACMVFPSLNQCNPGEHFKDLNQLKSFLQYDSYDFKIPRYIQLSIWTALSYLIFGFTGILISKLLSFYSKRGLFNADN